MPVDHAMSGPGEPTYLAAYKTMSNFRNHVLYVQFSATGLPAKDSLLHGGKADPFFHVMKAHGMVKSKAGEFTLFSTPVPGEYMGDDQQIPVYDGKSQVVKNTLNPKWKAFEISNFSSLCEDGDIRHPILIDIWDFNWYKDNTFMGYVVTSVYDLFEKHARGESIRLMPGRPGQKWGGVLHVDHIELIAKTGSYNQVHLGP